MIALIILTVVFGVLFVGALIVSILSVIFGLGLWFLSKVVLPTSGAVLLIIFVILILIL